MTKLSCLFAILIGLSLPTSALAELYTCKDSNGHLITSDRPIPECASKTTEVFSNHGTLITRLPPPMTAEQRRAAEELARQKTAEQAHQRDQDLERRFLRAHYPDETSIEVARKNELEGIRNKILTEEQTVKKATESLNQSKAALASLPAGQSSKRIDLQLKITSLQQTIQESAHLLQRYQAESVEVNRNYDTTHQRYLELISSPGH